MKLLKYILILFISSALLSGCVKRVSVATRNEKPVLVVEGSITTDSIPYSVKLTYSGPFTLVRDAPEESLVKDATVSIADNLGNSTPLTYKDSGRYETTDPNYIGKTGRSYHVNIQLKDGTRFTSKPEEIKPMRPIKNIKADFVMDFSIELPTYLNVAVDVQDPPSEENYYRWSFYSYIMKQTWGQPCGNNCIRFVYCYQLQTDNEVRILSDQFINGNEIKNQPVGRTYIYTYGNPYIEVSQHSITREAYQFWKRYQDQVSRTGGILDPLPAAIRGNVYNVDSKADFALGYFSASSVTRRKVILIPFNITEYILNISARSHIPEGFIACFDYYPNALPYPDGVFPPPPPGWENAERVEIHW